MGCFFFQAEDGIRDHCVTGVQTCALPIFTGNGEALHAHDLAREGGKRGRVRQALERVGRLEPPRRTRSSRAAAPRSEERRVGKECRSRWARNQYNKKRKRVTPSGRHARDK